MKINKKALDLVEKGLSSKLVGNLTESQVNVLHSKLMNEQVRQERKTVTKTTIPQSTLKTTGANVDGIAMKMDNAGNIVASQTEGEMGEEKKKESNPWAICTSQLGKEFGTTERSEWSKAQSNKYERCVRDVKKSLKEGKNPVTLFLENQIMSLVEKHIPPRITKAELINYLSEQGTETKPKPGTKEPKPGTKTPPKPRPSHPGKNPNPGENPAPKAKKGKISPEVAKDEILDLIKNILEK